MPEHEDNTQIPGDGPMVDRRAVLQKSLLGAVLAGASLATPTREASAAEPVSPTVRRVATGNNAKGKSTIIKDEVIKRDEMWHSDAKEPLGNGIPEDTHSLLPTVGAAGDLPVGGTRGYFFTIQPAKGPLDRATIKGWERSASIVYIYFLSGETTYVLDDTEVKVRAGDVLIQRNAMHTWHNHTDTPLTAFAVKVRV